MSEYQYFEFRMIDRRLTAEERATLRSFSTRASITATRFVNEYQWGDFRGDEDAWMEQYFDAFLYFANWGTRIFKLALPSHALDREIVDVYCRGDCASVSEGNGRMIITLTSEEDEPEWPEEDDALPDLIPIRAALARGDLRSLYVGWLLSAQAGWLDDDELEPPVPPGLRELNPSLERLVDFLRLDLDLLDVAAAASPPVSEASAASDRPRTVEALLRAAGQAAEERRREEAERAAVEQARRDEESAMARAAYLATLAKGELAVWLEIDQLIATKRPASYDRAVQLLVDLHDAAALQNREAGFGTRLAGLCAEHAHKPSFLTKLQAAGLSASTESHRGPNEELFPA